MQKSKDFYQTGRNHHNAHLSCIDGPAAESAAVVWSYWLSSTSCGDIPCDGTVGMSPRVSVNVPLSMDCPPTTTNNPLDHPGQGPLHCGSVGYDHQLPACTRANIQQSFQRTCVPSCQLATVHSCYVDREKALRAQRVCTISSYKVFYSWQNRLLLTTTKETKTNINFNETVFWLQNDWHCPRGRGGTKEGC